MHSVGDFIIEGLVKEGLNTSIDISNYIGLDLEVSHGIILHLLNGIHQNFNQSLRRNQQYTLYGEVLVDYKTNKYFFKIINCNSQFGASLENTIR